MFADDKSIEELSTVVFLSSKSIWNFKKNTPS